MDNEHLLNVPIKYSTNISISPTSIHRLNPEFSLCDVDVMYVDENRNGSDIPKEIVEEALYSLYGIPIVGEFLEEENRFGDHGEKIEISNGKISFTVTTKPLGFVTEEAVKTAEWIEKPLPNGHTMKTWLRLHRCILWNRYEKEVQYIIENGTSQSMEIKALDGYYTDDGTYKMTKIIFSALCAIGVEPAFEEANIRRAEYNMDSFKLEVQKMLDEYKKFNLELIENTKKEEKHLMDLKNLNEFLSEFTVGSGDDAVKRYILVGEQTDHSFTVIDGLDNFKIYTVEYALDEDGKVAAVWDEKVERKLSVVDYETENSIAIGEVVDFKAMADKVTENKITEVANGLNASYGIQIKEKDEAYANLEAKYNAAASKLAEYQKAELEAEKQAHREEINGIVDSFADRLRHSAKFLVYKAQLNPDEVTADQVNNDLVLILGQEMMSKNPSKFSYQPQETKVMAPVKTNNPYGHLLDKYIK